MLYLTVNKIVTLFRRSFAYFWVTMAYVTPSFSTEPRAELLTVTHPSS